MKKNKNYRFMIPAQICLSIIAKSQKEALQQIAKWREEMSDINRLDELVIDEPEICGQTVATFNVAVYIQDGFKITAKAIQDVEEFKTQK